MARKQGPKTKSGKFLSKSRPKKSKKKSKGPSGPRMIDSVQRKINLVSPASSKTGMFVELDKLLSQKNSKLYRQGMNYHARVVLNSDGTANNDTEFQIYTLPKDHRTIGAMRLAREIYN